MNNSTPHLYANVVSVGPSMDDRSISNQTRMMVGDDRSQNSQNIVPETNHCCLENIVLKSHHRRTYGRGTDLKLDRRSQRRSG
jgi:hypothetical protein